MSTLIARMSYRLLPAILLFQLPAGCARPQATHEDYAKVIDAYQQAVAEKPTDSSVRAGLAMSLARLHRVRGNWAESVDVAADLLRHQPMTCKQVETALTEGADREALHQLVSEACRLSEAQPEDAAACYICGRLLALTGEHDAALEQFRAAIRSNRTFAAPYAALARLLVEKKEWEEAIRAADTAIDAGLRDAGVYLVKGMAYDALDDADPAESAWMEAFAQDRRSAEALYLLAESLERRGRRERCEELYQQIVEEVDPRCDLAREKLFFLYLNSNRLDKAKECYAGFARTGKPGPAAERCRAMLNLATSQLPDANLRGAVYQDELRKIAADWPEDVATRLAQAKGYLAINNQARAMACLDQALKLDPDNIQAREVKRTLDVILLKFPEATALVKGLLKDRPRDAGYLQDLLELAKIQADYDTAVDVLQKLLQRDDLGDRHQWATAELIQALLDDRRYGEAVETARQWLAEAPDDQDRRNAWLITLTRAGRNDEAINAVNRWLADDPANAGLRHRLIAQLQAAGRNTQAQEQVLSWLADDPDDMELNQLLISLLLAAKQWNSAIDVAQAGAESPEHQSTYETLLGLSYAQAGRFDEAIDLYRDRANSESTEDAYDDLLTVLIRAERFVEAEELASKLVVVSSELARRDKTRLLNPAALASTRRKLARIYELTDRQEQAAQQLEAVYGLMPTDPGASNDLGYTWADAGERIEDAERLIRFAVAKKPQEPSYLDSMGWVLYKQGNFRDAVYFLRLAIRKSATEDPVVLDHLGDALYRGGSSGEARDCWDKALGLTASDRDPPPDAEQRRLHEKLKAKLEQAAKGGEVVTAPLAPPGSKAGSTQPSEESPPSEERNDADLEAALPPHGR